MLLLESAMSHKDLALYDMYACVAPVGISTLDVGDMLYH